MSCWEIFYKSISEFIDTQQNFQSRSDPQGRRWTGSYDDPWRLTFWRHKSWKYLLWFACIILLLFVSRLWKWRYPQNFTLATVLIIKREREIFLVCSSHLFVSYLKNNVCLNPFTCHYKISLTIKMFLLLRSHELIDR